MKAPMQFQPRKNVAIDYEIKRMIDEMVITIPIVWIKGTLYLVGINRIHMEMKAEDVIAQIGGGYEKFELYIKKQHKVLERGLLIKMIQSKESLEWIVDALIKGTKIPNHSAITYDSSTGFYQDPRQLPGSRIQIEKRPSHRVNKEGLMGSPTRLRASQGTGGFGIASPKLNRNASPLRSPSSAFRKTKIATSPSPRRGGGATPSRSAQMTQSEQKQIRQVVDAFGQKKAAVLKEIDKNVTQRGEHISNKDQTVLRFNQGKYSYIHNK